MEVHENCIFNTPRVNIASKIDPDFDLYCYSTVMEGDVLTFGQLIFNVHLTPGHTVGHLIYELDCTAFGAPPSVFSGDHLFLGGCGEFFNP